MAFEEAYALYRLAKVEALSEGGKEQVSNSTKTTTPHIPMGGEDNLSKAENSLLPSFSEDKGLNGKIFVHIGESPPSDMMPLTFSPCWEVGTRKRMYTPCGPAIESMKWCQHRQSFIYLTVDN